MFSRQIWSRLWFGRTRVWFHHHALRPGCGRHRRTGGGINGRHQPRHRPPPCPRHHCPLCRPLCCPHPHRHPRRHPRCRRRRGALDRGRAATAATAAAPIDLSAAREGVRRWVRSRGACACVPCSEQTGMCAVCMCYAMCMCAMSCPMCVYVCVVSNPTPSLIISEM